MLIGWREIDTARICGISRVNTNNSAPNHASELLRLDFLPAHQLSATCLCGSHRPRKCHTCTTIAVNTTMQDVSSRTHKPPVDNLMPYSGKCHLGPERIRDPPVGLCDAGLIGLTLSPVQVSAARNLPLWRI